jgi:hypothetical protein
MTTCFRAPRDDYRHLPPRSKADVGYRRLAQDQKMPMLGAQSARCGVSVALSIVWNA